MSNVQREDIYFICEHTKIKEEAIDKLLQEEVYTKKALWQKYLPLFFIVLGIGFFVCGMVFFFAYNWDALHKFVKIGLAESLILLTSLSIFLPKVNATLKKIILTGASVIVGVLFAVYGQIYQTGANAFDFFLVWTVFITLWVIINDYTPLWLIYLLLINVTLILYEKQVASGWSTAQLYGLLFCVNSAAICIYTFYTKYKQKKKLQNWFAYTVSLAAITCGTISILWAIFSPDFIVLPIITVLVFMIDGIGIYEGYNRKNIFYIAIIYFSLIVILSGLFLKISNGSGMFLFIGIFIVGSVTLLIKKLINLQNRWTHER